MSVPFPTASERHARPGHPDAAGSAPCRPPRLVQAGLEEGTEATPRRTDVRRTAGKASDELRTAPRAVGFIPNLSKMWQPASERLQVGTAGKAPRCRCLRSGINDHCESRRRSPPLSAGLRGSGPLGAAPVRSAAAPFGRRLRHLRPF